MLCFDVTNWRTGYPSLYLYNRCIHSLSLVSCFAAGNHNGRLAKYRGQSQMGLINFILIFKVNFNKLNQRITELIEEKN